MMGFLSRWLLTILLLVPAIGGAAMPFIRSRRAVRFTSIGIALATVALALLILIPFHRQQGTAYEYSPAGTVQMVREAELLPNLHAGFRVAIDGLSIPFVVLTTILTTVFCTGLPADADRANAQFTMLLWLETATLGVFVSFDLLLLWLFLALSIVPCCGLLWLSWGDRRARVMIAFLWPMLAGLACLLVAALGERLVSTHCFEGGTLDLVRLAACHAGGSERTLFALALIGFLVRVPVFPFHAWPSIVTSESSAVVAAAVGSVVPLAGGYGLFRVVLPLFPSASDSLWWVMAGIGLFSLVYHSLAAIGQSSFRREATHVYFAMFGFVLLGAAVKTPAGLNGGVFMLLSSGLVAAFVALDSGPWAEKAADEPSRTGFAQSGSKGGLMAGALAVLVVPGLLGQAIVLFGTFEAAQRDSVLIGAHAATLGSLFAVASAECVGILLLGAAEVQATRRAVDLSSSATVPQITERSAPNAGAPMVAAILLVLFGVMAAPFCFGFTRRALEALMARALHS